MSILQHTEIGKPTLTDALWPAEAGGARVVRSVVLALAGSVILAISAKIQVPFWPVPMTMQTFAVTVIGMAYGLHLGTATVLLYLAEGAVGLPVFAGGSGLAYFAGPTGGYLIGFAAAAALCGWLAERGWDRSVWLTVAAMTLGTLIIFAFGLPWLAVFLAAAKSYAADQAISAAIVSGFVPFIAASVFKIALAAAVLPGAWWLIGRHT